MSNLKKNNPNDLKTFSIVIQENMEHNGHGFFVFLKSDNPEHLKNLNDMIEKGCTMNDLSAGEFYSNQLFALVTNALQQAGAVNNIYHDDKTVN